MITSLHDVLCVVSHAAHCRNKPCISHGAMLAQWRSVLGIDYGIELGIPEVCCITACKRIMQRLLSCTMSSACQGWPKQQAPTTGHEMALMNQRAHIHMFPDVTSIAIIRSRIDHKAPFHGRSWVSKRCAISCSCRCLPGKCYNGGQG